MNNVAFIINPFSAKKNYEPFFEALKKRIDQPVVYISDSVQGTFDFIDSNFAQIDIFVAVGGDGTISTVARKIIGTDKILAVFPAGSGNGFSNETKFTRNLEDLLSKIKNKKVKKIDTFTVNGRLSINVSGTGFDGKVVKEFEKTSRGFRNYIQVSMRTFINYKPIKVNFLTENLKSYNGEYLMLNIANTRQFGNHAYIAPHASKSDGLLDIVLVKKFPLQYAVRFAYRMFTKKLKDDEFVTYLPVAEVEFEVNTTNWHLDGEFHRIESPVKIKIAPKSLNILV
ncbi:Transcription regulator (contains diacylglycerol kinase catalytic domain) [Flavobacteriaceae bacterium 3519-10]|nr:Transcription regulator (contains diacylglycerol kinase catalytic domain) [Flavobacteriaceae bacterium 3519-10]